MRPLRPASVPALATCLLLAACVPRPRAVTTPSGLRYTVLARGDDDRRPARRGQLVSILQQTTLADGTVVSATGWSGARTFRLGTAALGPGIDEGVAGMREGERRLIVVPPALRGAHAASADVPPGASLLVDVRLVRIIPERGVP